jgi:hypothetical protein
MGKKLSTFIGDSTYTRAPPNYRSPLRSNNTLLVESVKKLSCFALFFLQGNYFGTHFSKLHLDLIIVVGHLFHQLCIF